jgi:hypothetical protein
LTSKSKGASIDGGLVKSQTSAVLKAKNPTAAEAPIDALPDFVHNFIERPSR